MTQTPDSTVPTQRYSVHDEHSVASAPVSTDTTPTTDSTAELTEDSQALTGDDQ